MHLQASSIKNKIRHKINLENFIYALLFILLIIFVLYPIFLVFVRSFYINGVFSVESYTNTFLNKSTYRAIKNTFIVSSIVLILTWIIGGGLAYIRVKTNYKYRKLIDVFVFLTFTIPAYILAVTWILGLSRGGYLSRLIKLISNEAVYDYNAYSLFAASIVLTVHMYPIVYYGVSNALKLTGNSLEEAAKVCGLSKKTTIKNITLPLVLPAFLSTGILVVSRSISNYGVTSLLAVPSGNDLLVTRVFSSMSDLDLGVVAVQSIFIISISFLLFFLSNFLIKNKRYYIKEYTKETNKKYEKNIFINIFLIIFFFITFFLPFLIIIISSFFKRWGLSFELSNLTLNNYKMLFGKNKILVEPLINSLKIGIIGGLFSTLFSSLIVYINKNKESKKNNLLMYISLLPIAVPNIILAIAAMFAWINPPIKLYGTFYILLITYIVLFLPICIKQIEGGTKNIDNSLNEVSKTMGINIIKRYFILFIPQIKDSLYISFIMCFLIALKEIPISLMLYSAGNKTLGVMMFTVQTNSYGLEMTSAISVIIIFMSLVGRILLYSIKKGCSTWA